MTLVYDVTHLRSSPNALTELIQNSIDSEQWLDTGSGLGTISAIRIRQTNLLVVTQTYEVHRQMHALLGDIALASGARQSKLTVPSTQRHRRDSKFHKRSLCRPSAPSLKERLACASPKLLPRPRIACAAEAFFS